MSDRQKHCIVIGVGPGTGLATVKHFAENGYFVSMIARHAGRLTGTGRSRNLTGQLVSWPPVGGVRADSGCQL